ncbi:MAG: class I SAM-dependent methyltransferase, partial [Corallincola sp.]|nr:class I SAM-dependent methyltransferase [Corallincola sp.]
MELVSQLLNRHADALPPRVLFVNPPDQLPAGRRPPLLWSTDWLSARHWGAACHFGAEPPAALEVDLVVINWPKSHRLGHYQLAALAARVAPGTALWLVGEKRGGVATAAKQLSASPGPWQPPHKADAARHCLLFTSALQQQGSAVSLTPLAPFTIDSGKGALRLASFAGVFGEGGLDEGSALLLGCLNDLPEGPLVDVGCGCGVLGLSLAQRGHRQVTLCDVNAMALAASRYNASANGLQVEVVASDLL